jgi:hypothetical protein
MCIILYLFVGLLPTCLISHLPLCCTFPLSGKVQHNTAAHCTVAAVWLPLFHITFPSCLSLPADCHLPLPLTTHDHEPEARYLLHVTAVWTFVPPWNPRPCSFLLHPNFSFGLPNNYCDLARLEKLQVTTHTLLQFPTIPVAYVPV